MENRVERSEALRSHRWFGPDDLRSFGHRSRLKGMGFADEDYLGKPVIGILNTWSDLNTCHSHLRERAEEVKRGVWQAGGFPVEVPVMSLGEMLMPARCVVHPSRALRAFSHGHVCGSAHCRDGLAGLETQRHADCRLL
jgi:dihydroxyacid dehydratase/phosphogluconate dehydratase